MFSQSIQDGDCESWLLNQLFRFKIIWLLNILLRLLSIVLRSLLSVPPVLMLISVLVFGRTVPYVGKWILERRLDDKGSRNFFVRLSSPCSYPCRELILSSLPCHPLIINKRKTGVRKVINRVVQLLCTFGSKHLVTILVRKY